jgi:hypothetical protein
MRKEAKNFFVSFAKTNENEAKQDAFSFEAKIKKERKRDTLVKNSIVTVTLPPSYCIF